MPDSEDLPDSATTARESVYRSRSHTSDGTYNRDDCLDFEKKEFEDAVEKPPSSKQRGLSPIKKDRQGALDDDDKVRAGNGSESRDRGSQSTKRREFWKFRMRPADDDEEQ